MVVVFAAIYQPFVQSSPHLPRPTRPSSTGRIAFALLFAVLAYVAAVLAADADLATRRVTLRMWALLGAGLFAVAAPNVLAPDPSAPVQQLLNRSPARLLRLQLRRWLPVVGLFVVPAWVLAFFDPANPAGNLLPKAAYAAQATLVLLATGLYSFDVYATIGATSQAWNEGREGQWYHRARDTYGQGFDVPPGLVPALFATARCFGAGILVVVAGSMVFGVAPGWTWVPAALFLGWTAARVVRHRSAFDRHYYHTNAFYGEVLGGGSLGASDREPIAIESLYWIPQAVRPAAWASLRQLDRRLPMGRLIALGHVVLWVLLAQEASDAAVTSTLLLIVGVQNAAGGILATSSMAAPTLHLVLQSPTRWWMSRFFVNLRWLAPLVASLSAVAIFSDALPWSSVGVWAAIDVAAALVAAALTTAAAEVRARRRHR